jgi:hypothetical protein
MFGHKKGLEHKLREDGGTVAWATIVAVDKKWSSARGGDSGFGAPSQVTDHVRVTLNVEPDGEAPFQATFRQAFPDHTPRIGGHAKVIYDPADHSRIAIMEGEVYMPGLSVEKQQRSRARAAEAQAAADSGHLDEYIARRKEEAMQSAANLISSSFAAAPGAATPANVVDQLAKLAALRDRGVLTDEEFQAEKAKLLTES